MSTKRQFFTCWFYLLLACLFSCCEAHEISVHVVDDRSKPVPSADIVISFDYQDRVVRKGKSDTNGVFKANGPINPAAFLEVTKVGFYKHTVRRGLDAQNHDLEILLRARVDPIALIVRKAELTVPSEEKSLGFDLEVGDWLAPHGNGHIADFIIEMQREFKGMKYQGRDMEKIRQVNKDESEETLKAFYGKWDAELVFLVPVEGGGFIETREAYIPNIELSMPNEAPDVGYANTLSLNGSTYHQDRAFAAETGYFLRTRVVKRNGAITRANYAKIVGGIEIHAGRGEISFTYYFNPTPNDRNLEFKPKNNLATEQTRYYPP